MSCHVGTASDKLNRIIYAPNSQLIPQFEVPTNVNCTKNWASSLLHTIHTASSGNDQCISGSNSRIYTQRKTPTAPDSGLVRAPPPRCPYWADHNQNFLNLVAPCLVHVCHIWSGLVGVCRSYSRNIAFSDPSHYSLQYTRLKRVYRLTAYNYNSAGEWR